MNETQYKQKVKKDKQSSYHKGIFMYLFLNCQYGFRDDAAI